MSFEEGMRFYDYDTDVKVTDFENFFKLYQKGNYIVFNLNTTADIDVSDDNKLWYTLKTNAHWPLISFKLYGTPRLSWLLMKINNVGAEDIFKRKNAGDKIAYVSKENVEYILQSLRS